MINGLSKRAKCLKFEIILTKIVRTIEKVIHKNFCTAFGFVSLVLQHCGSENTRLSKIKRLKSKISIEANRIETKLSKSQSSKDHWGKANYQLNFEAHRSREVFNRNTKFGFDKEHNQSKSTIDEENKILEISIKQTENFLQKFMKEINQQMQFGGKHDSSQNL